MGAFDLTHAGVFGEIEERNMERAMLRLQFAFWRSWSLACVLMACLVLGLEAYLTNGAWAGETAAAGGAASAEASAEPKVTAKPGAVSKSEATAEPEATAESKATAKLEINVTSETPLAANVAMQGTPTLVREWNFDQDGDREGWNSAQHLENIEVKNAVLRFTCNNWDPFIVAKGLEPIAAHPWNVVQMKIRFVENEPLVRNAGELFFSNTDQGPYGGFGQDRAITWERKKTTDWQIVEIYPFWNREEKIVQLRMDFPGLIKKEDAKYTAEIDWIRVVDLNLNEQEPIQPQWTFDFGQETTASQTTEWLSPLFMLDAKKAGDWLVLEVASDENQIATFEWMRANGQFASWKVVLPKSEDGKPLPVNVHVGASKAWAADVHQFRFRSASPVSLKTLGIYSEPRGEACPAVRFSGVEDALVRVGYDSAFFLDLVNCGGRDSEEIQFANVQVPEGIELAELPTLEPLKLGERRRLLFPFKATKEVTHGKIAFQLTSGSLAPISVEIPVEVLPSLNLPKAEYVPEPKPLKSDYEIGALYFPGWYQGHSWERIWTSCPSRLPMLGWYNESDPEVIDWQIKWAAENGIRFFLVDWYWNRGNRSLEHWVKGFQKARHRKYLKWAMMWANHNGPGSHSLEDQAAVTQYWIKNYFNTPEYYTIDGCPVVMIWSPQGMDDDVWNIEAKKGNTLNHGEGVKMLLDLSQKMAKEAGFKGICFIAMKWPEASTNAGDIQWLADAGFSMTSIYHFMSDGGKAENPRRFSFDLVKDAARPYWENRAATGILPFLPNLATGWDDRPWNDSCWIYGRTPEKFRELCQQFKEFADASGVKRAVLAPVNEWGEGSYAEPCREFGFGMYEAIRETFCEKPAEGWPVNYTPKDVGLGPYELRENVK